MQHTINIYQRPAQGSAFVARYPVTGYRHRITAMGGYDTASCQISAPGYAADLFLERHLGALVRVYADNPAMPCWEGLITRITTGDYTVALQDMANRMTVQYTTYSGYSSSVTTPSNDTDSQAAYGIKEDTLEWGAGFAPDTNETRQARLQATALEMRAWPQKSVTDGKAGVISIEMEGIYHTLEWEKYRYMSSGIVTYSTWITGTFLPGLANSSTFFDNTDMSAISTNAANRRNYETGSRSAWEVLQKLAEAGDGATRWIVGITPTGFGESTRRLYYRAANDDIEYTARLSDGRRPRNLYGRLVAPWEVRPDRGIRITDVLLGWSGVGDNPTETYITQVEYDAESQSVKWYGNDSVEAEAQFQLNKGYLPTNKRFGSPLRTLQ